MLMGHKVFTLGLTVFTMHDNIYPVQGSTEAGIKWNGEALLVGQLLWATSVTFIRASVLSLYIRIFQTPTFRATCYTVLGFNLTYYAAVVLTSCLICRPIALLWDPSRHGSCGNQKSFDLFIGVFNLLMDVTTVALPMPVLWGLQLQTKKKLVIAGMFSMGIAYVPNTQTPNKEETRADVSYSICAITMYRIKITRDIDEQDPWQQYLKLALLTCLEAQLGIINACLPLIKPIFKKLGATSIFNSWWIRTPSGRSGKPINTSRSNLADPLSCGKGKSPYMDPSRQIIHKNSLHMFSADFRTDSRADMRTPSLPVPSFSWRPLSSLHLPKVEQDHDPSGLEKDIAITTDWEGQSHLSGSDSPTLPWRPQ